MTAKSLFGLTMVLLLSCPAAAQFKQPPQVDWEAKAIATELGRLGDPEIKMFLPELYNALRESNAAAQDAAAQEAGAPVTAKEKLSVRPSLLSLLSNPSVRREIEMIDEQYEEIVERSRVIQSELTKHIGSLVLASDGGIDPEEIRRKISEIREAAKKEIEKSVLPFQLKRLEEVAYHVEMQRQGVVGVLVNDPLASELGITDDQKNRLRKRGKEIEEKLAREIARLRTQAREELFSELKSDQRQKLSKIIGDDFELKEKEGLKSLSAKNKGSAASLPKGLNKVQK